MADVFTIDDLNALTTLTATDEVPVWDSEESGEPTKKITASNLAASVKSLASLPSTTEMNTAIQQSTAKYGNVTFLRYWNASTLTVDLGFIPTINKGAQAVLFNANQRVLALILFGGSDDSRYVNVSGTITYTISHNDSVYTITASSVLWGNTTLLVDHG